MTESTEAWRNYTIEPWHDHQTAAVCRDPEMGGSCEWNNPPAGDYYLTLGEALDAAQAHHRWHQANPESCADGEGDPDWAKLPAEPQATLADLMNLIIPGEWTFALNSWPPNALTAILTSSQGPTHTWIGTDPQTMLTWALRCLTGRLSDLGVALELDRNTTTDSRTV